MKKVILFVGLFIFSFMLFSEVKVNAATEVYDEASLRSAIEQGGDIMLAQNISVSEPLVIDKDVSMSCAKNKCIIDNNMDEDLIIVNGGNVEMVGVSLYAGKYKYDDLQGGTALTVNGGFVKIGVLDTNKQSFIQSGDTSVVVNNEANVSLIFPRVYSYNKNGIEVNNGAVVNIEGGVDGCDFTEVFGVQNAIYLNGGTVNLSSRIEFSTSDTGYTIYMNKGVNTAANDDALVFKDDFMFSYQENKTFSFNIYVNPNITELRLTDEKNFLVLDDNKLNVGYCSDYYLLCTSQSEKDRETICKNYGGSYNGTIESNELKSCAAVYINGEKTIIDEENCKTEVPAQIVTVPSTFLSNIYYVVIGVVLVIIAVFIIYMIVSKKKVKNK